MTHIVRERIRVHRDLWVSVTAEQRCSLGTDGSIAQRRALRAHGDDSYVLGHALTSRGSFGVRTGGQLPTGPPPLLFRCRSGTGRSSDRLVVASSRLACASLSPKHSIR